MIGPLGDKQTDENAPTMNKTLDPSDTDTYGVTEREASRLVQGPPETIHKPTIVPAPPSLTQKRHTH